MTPEETITRLKRATPDSEEATLIQTLAERAKLVEPQAHKRLKRIFSNIDDYTKTGRWAILASQLEVASEAARALQDLNYKIPPSQAGTRVAGQK